MITTMKFNLLEKQTYVSPAVTSIEVKSEQVLCSSFSSTNEDYGFVGGAEGEEWF